MTKTAVPGGGRSRGCQAYDGASVEKVADAESGMVYRGPELSYLAITLRVARSFTDKPKGVKVHRTRVIRYEMMNGEKTLNKVGTTKTSLR
jgi:hypothetical protein